MRTDGCFLGGALPSFPTGFTRRGGNRLTRFVRLGLFLTLFSTGSTSWADLLTGRVVAVKDGDTLVVLDASKSQHTIRLMGIDAPEKRMPFGQRAKQALSDLVYDRTVTVDWNKTDRYGRTIGKVLVGGSDANLQMIRLGMAWHYKQYAREQDVQDRGLYAEAETQARSARTGLWVDANPVPPWEFRHRKRQTEGLGSETSLGERGLHQR